MRDEHAEDRAARESDRPIRRHRHLRRQGHGVSALEVRPARQGLPLPACSTQQADGRPLWSTTSRPAGGGAAPPAFGRRVVGLQRHRHAAVVPAEAAEAGARRARLSTSRRRTRSTTRTRWSRCRTRRRASSATTPSADADRPFVEVSGRKGLGRQGRRPARSADRQGRGEVAKRNPELAAEDDARASPRRSPSPRSATSW